MLLMRDTVYLCNLLLPVKMARGAIDGDATLFWYLDESVVVRD